MSQNETDRSWNLDLIEVLLVLAEKWRRGVIILAASFLAIQGLFIVMKKRQEIEPTVQVQYQIDRFLPKGTSDRVRIEYANVRWPTGFSYAETGNNGMLVHGKVTWQGPASKSNEAYRGLSESRESCVKGVIFGVFNEGLLGPLPGFYPDSSLVLKKRIEMQRDEIRDVERLAGLFSGSSPTRSAYFQRVDPSIPATGPESSNGLATYRTFGELLEARRDEMRQLERQLAIAEFYEERCLEMATIRAFVLTNRLNSENRLPDTFLAQFGPQMIAAASRAARFSKEPWLHFSEPAFTPITKASVKKFTTLQALLIALFVAILGVLLPHWFVMARERRRLERQQSS